MAAKSSGSGVAVNVNKIDIQRVRIKIKGISPLIMHRFSEKARKEMLDKQMKKSTPRKPKDPEEQFEQSLYRFEDGRLGFPADGFKKAMIRGAKMIGMVMTDARSSFFVEGKYSAKDDRDLVELNGDLSMREDMVRISQTSDIRFRGQVSDWSADLNISYNRNATTVDNLVNMLVAAGYGCGVGEWRPERDGSFGRFEVVVESAA